MRCLSRWMCEAISLVTKKCRLDFSNGVKCPSLASCVSKGPMRLRFSSGRSREVEVHALSAWVSSLP